MATSAAPPRATPSRGSAPTSSASSRPRSRPDKGRGRLPHPPRRANGRAMNAHKPGDPNTLNRLYGLSKTKPLRAGQQDMADTLSTQNQVPAAGEGTAGRVLGSAG